MHRQGTDFQIQLQGYKTETLYELQDRLETLVATGFEDSTGQLRSSPGNEKMKSKLVDVNAELQHRNRRPT